MLKFDVDNFNSKFIKFLILQNNFTNKFLSYKFSLLLAVLITAHIFFVYFCVNKNFIRPPLGKRSVVRLRVETALYDVYSTEYNVYTCIIYRAYGSAGKTTQAED